MVGHRKSRIGVTLINSLLFLGKMVSLLSSTTIGARANATVSFQESIWKQEDNNITTTLIYV
jgi:hypothetical protein